MNDSVREMTAVEMGEYLINKLETDEKPILMWRWEKDFVKKALKSEVQFLTFAKMQGYQPTIEQVINIPTTQDINKFAEELDKLYLEKCEEINRLKEKQTPKQVIFKHSKSNLRYLNCPTCDTTVKFSDNYCKICGQALKEVFEW